MQKGPSYSSSAATYPEKSAKAQSRNSVSMRDCAFFPPSLDPVLDRGKRNENPVVSPQVPTCRAVGQTVFDHDADCQIDHSVGILTARWGQVREVGAKVLTTLRTVMLGIGHQQIPRTPHIEIPQIMQCPIRLLVPIGRVTTTWARLPDVVATVGDDLGLWQGCGCCDPGAGVGSILPWTEHRIALLAQRFGPELYNNRFLGTTRCSRYSLRKSADLPDHFVAHGAGWSFSKANPDQCEPCRVDRGRCGFMA